MCGSVCESRFVSVTTGDCRLRVCLSRQASVRLSRGCLLRRCGSSGRACHGVSVRLWATVTGVRLGPPGPRVLAQGEGEGGEVAAQGSGEGRGRRQWAGAGGGAVRPRGVCAGGRRRRLPESAQPAPGNIGRLLLPARPGRARPPQVSLPPRPGPSPSRRPLGVPGTVRHRSDLGLQTWRPPRPRACPAASPAAPHSWVTLPSPPHTYRSPLGRPLPLQRLEFLRDPRAPLPR